MNFSSRAMMMMSIGAPASWASQVRERSGSGPGIEAHAATVLMPPAGECNAVVPPVPPFPRPALPGSRADGEIRPVGRAARRSPPARAVRGWLRVAPATMHETRPSRSPAAAGVLGDAPAIGPPIGVEPRKATAHRP